MRTSFIFILAFSLSLHAADLPAGGAARVLRTTRLRGAASGMSKSFGKIPRDTIVLIKGEEKDGFVPVQVELEDDETIEGWVAVDALTTRSKEVTKEEIETGEGRQLAEDEKNEKKLRIRIPRDEGILFGRTPSFYYGLQVGPHFDVLDPEIGDRASGIGLSAGALVGVFLSPEFPVRAEFGYTMLNGSGEQVSSVGTVSTSKTTLGFLNAALIGAFRFDRFEIHVGGEYAYGVSLSDLPGSQQAKSADELSSGYILGGLGYFAPIGEVTSLSLQFRYSYSLTHGPLRFHQFSLLLGVNLNG